MDTIFNELVDQYQNYRLASVAYGLFVEEAETFAQSVQRRIDQLQGEHNARIAELGTLLDGIDVPAERSAAEAELAELREFPARVTDCELAAFEGITHTVEEATAEVHKFKLGFCDGFEAATAELERIRACYSTDSRKASRYAEAFENIKESWDQMILGKEPTKNESF